MKKYIKVIILVTIIAAWMGVIFSFSMEDADKSTDSSRSFIRFLYGLLIPDFDEMSASKQALLVAQITHFIRKLAHFTVYTVLGMILYTSFTLCGRLGRKYMELSVLLGAIYAASDEIHQYFVPGRACMIRDVLLDTCGVVFGVATVYLITKLVDRIKNKKSPDSRRTEIKPIFNNEEKNKLKKGKHNGIL